MIIVFFYAASGCVTKILNACTYKIIRKIGNKTEQLHIKLQKKISRADAKSISTRKQ